MELSQTLVWCPLFCHLVKLEGQKYPGDLHDKLFQLPRVREGESEAQSGFFLQFYPHQKWNQIPISPRSPETHKVAKGLASTTLV